MINKNKTVLKKSSCADRLIFSLLLAGATIFPMTVQAGFEWQPAPPAIIEGPAVVAMPAENVEAKTLPKYQGVAAVVEDVDIDSFPREQEDAFEMSSFVEQVSDKKEIMGFGNDIPLAFALGQIVPAEYAYSFDNDVNRAQRISWNGGKPWDVVLQQALGSHGLGVSIIDKTVWVRHASAEVVPKDSMSMPFDQHDVLNDAAFPNQHPDPFMEPPVSYQMSGPSFGEDYNIEQEMDYQPSYPRRKPIPLMMESDIPSPPEVGQVSEPVSEYENYNGAQYLEPVDLANVDAAPSMDSPQSQYDFNPFAPEMNIMSGVPSASMGKALDPFEIKFWKAERGQSLFSVLSNWSGSSDVALNWRYEGDYILPETIEMHSTYADAVEVVLSSYGTEGSRPLGRLHPNLPTGPSMLIIEDSGS